MLILASASPRRREILSMLGYEYLVLPAEADETLPEGIAPADAVAELSARKAEAVAAARPDDVVIGADTVVCCGGEILGKPADRTDAARMLRLLSGKTHEVCTGVTVIAGGRRETRVTVSKVTFLPLTEEEIEAYVETGEPLDKAGAYAVQGKGSALIESVCGDFFAVMGLSSAVTAKLLASFGVEPVRREEARI